jgi:hypothetical protein
MSLSVAAKSFVSDRYSDRYSDHVALVTDDSRMRWHPFYTSKNDRKRISSWAACTPKRLLGDDLDVRFEAVLTKPLMLLR